MFDGAIERNEPSAKAIVAAVRPPLLYQSAAKEAKSLRIRGAAIQRELSAAIAERRNDPRSAVTDERILELDAERSKIAQEYIDAVNRTALHRPSYAQKVNAALAALRLDAARRAQGALAQLETAMSDLREADDAARAVGIEAQVRMPAPDIEVLRAALRRQVELAGGAN